MFAPKVSDASPRSHRCSWQLNIYALVEIAIMTNSLHAGHEWFWVRELRRNVDVRRVNVREDRWG